MPSVLSKWKHKRAELSSSAGSTPRSASSTRQESIAGRAATTPLTEANDDPPLSSEAIPGIAVIHQSLQERLWNQAYDGVKDADPKLVEAYERILGLELRQRSAGTAIDESDEILQTPELRAVQMQELVQIGLKKTQREAAVKQGISDSVAAIEAVKSIIDKSVKASPEAAVAWVGICFAIEILSNPIAEAGLHRSGISYVVSRMDWYWNLSGLLLEENKAHTSTAGLREQLEKHVLELYRKLLAFQIKSVCVHYKSKALNFLRDMLQLDDWGGRLQSIKDSEDAVRNDSAQFNTQQVQWYLHSIAEAANSQESRLQDIHLAFQVHSAQQKELYEDENYKKCLKDLRGVDPRDDKTRIEKAKGGLLKDCCRWIFSHDGFQRWHGEATDSRILWIKGDPGKGKTMLLCSVIDEIAASTVELSYFFCQAAEAKLSNAAAVLRGLIYMLVAQQPLLISHVRAKYDEAGKALFEDHNAWQALSKILAAILADDRLGDAVLFVDALDECVTDMPELIDFITTQAASTTNKAKWVITSRNWLSIEEKLLGVKGVVPIHIERLENDPVARAVGAYIEYKVNSLAQHKKYKSETKTQVLKYLSSNANDTFLWVALVCHDLADSKVRERHTLARLHLFPAGLEPLYERMLAQIDEELDAEICKQILSVMTILYRPVSTSELACLAKGLDSLEEDVESLEEIISLCGSFLELRDGFVSFIHKSAKDFLRKADGLVPPNKTQQLHGDVFLQSLKALSIVLRRDMYGLPLGIHVDSVLTPKPDPLSSIRYACVYFVDHLESSKEPGHNFGDEPHLRDGGPLDDFLRSNYLFWLEALSLLRSIAQGCAALNKLEALLVGTPSGNLIALVYDASRFLLWHRVMIETTPLQIYVSVLLFTPTQSAVRKLYEDHIPAWVKKRPPVPETWSSVIQSLEGHSDHVTDMIQAPVRRWLATASSDGTVKIWDLISGRCLYTLDNHDPVATQMRSPDSEESMRLPLGVNSGGVSPLKVRNEVWCVHISADESRLAYGSADGTIRVWSLVKGEKPSYICTLEAEWAGGAPMSVICLSLSNSGHLVSVVQDTETAKVWDISKASSTQELRGHTQRIAKAVISPQGSRVASRSHRGSIRLWCRATGKCLRTLTEGGVNMRDIVFSPDSRWLASCTGETTVQLWDAESGVCLRSFSPCASATALSFRPDSSQLVLGTQPGTIEIWDLAGGEGSKPLAVSFPYYATHVALSQDGQRLVAVQDHRKSPVILDTSSTEGYEDKSVYIPLACIAPLRTRPFLAACTIHAIGQCQIWNIGTSSSLGIFYAFWDSSRNWMMDAIMAFSENGRWLAVTELPNERSAILDLETGMELMSKTTINYSGAPVDCTFSPDSRWLVVASKGTQHMVEVWDMEKRGDGWAAEKIFTAVPGILGETLVQCEKGDQHLVNGDDNSISTQYAFTALAFSVATGLLAVACGRGNHNETETYPVLILDVSSGACVRVLAGHAVPIERVAFSEDGSRIASADSCHHVRVWDAATGERTTGFRVNSLIQNLEFCPGSSSSLFTEHGQISLSYAEAAREGQELPLVVHHGYRMDDEWIWYGTERLLRLPPEYTLELRVRGNMVRPNADGGSTTVFTTSPRNQITWFDLWDYDSYRE